MHMQSIDRILHIVLILLDKVLMNLMSHILLMFQVMEFIVIPIVHMLLLLYYPLLQIGYKNDIM